MVPPNGLAWRDESELTATFRPRRSQGFAFAVASLWNFGLALATLLSAKPPPVWFTGTGFIGAFVFALAALRGFSRATLIRVEGSDLVIRSTLTPWARFRAPLSTIDGFRAVLTDDGASHVVALRRGSGHEDKVPIDLELLPFGLYVAGRKRRLWPAPAAHAEYVASRLEEIAEAGRRAAHTTYRA